ncbi:hypothetical protein BDW42DRAFT_180124 [Aspergillus taichungensis]|uniref:Uncharacterized protein n=1 Tax=Aspergillus taichungensis TaxID=482145 RepID=A0A2J5HFV7_9EURO|nr:hypothetical protein BDW42DRAFT_180124 [Aspergillus taichungensis]
MRGDEGTCRYAARGTPIVITIYPGRGSNLVSEQLMRRGMRILRIYLIIWLGFKCGIRGLCGSALDASDDVGGIETYVCASVMYLLSG